MGIFSTKNKFKMDALRIKERGSKDTPTNFSEEAVAFMKGMPGYYPKFTGGGGEGEIDESKIQNIKVVEGEGGRKLYGEILGDNEGDAEGLMLGKNVGFSVCLEGLKVGTGVGDSVALRTEPSPANRLNLEGAQHWSPEFTLIVGC